MSALFKIILYYFFIHFLFLNIAFYILKKYYKRITYKEKETGKEISIQEKYAPLVPNDSLNYFPFIFIGTIFFPLRIYIVLLLFYILSFHIKILKLFYKNYEKDESQRKKIEKAAYFWISIYFFINNITVEKKQIKFKEIYKKYLGENYDFDLKDFALYISNHLGYLEIVAFMREYGLSLLITFELLRAPGVGAAMWALDSFFINRKMKKVD